MSRRRSVALIITLLLVTLLATTTTQLATMTSVESIVVSRRHQTVRHELAIDSVLRITAQRVTENRLVVRDLDSEGEHVFTFDLGSCNVRVRLADDGARFDVNAFADKGDHRQLSRKLRQLARSSGLPTPGLDIRPLADDEPPGRRFVWFDQLFSEIAPTEVYRWDDASEQPVWSDVITCFGDGRIDLKRANKQTLSAMLDDIDRGLARRLIEARKRGGNLDISAAMQRIDPDSRSQIQARVGYDMHRYAMNIKTAIGGDHRRWYVVATINDGNVEVHHRGMLRW